MCVTEELEAVLRQVAAGELGVSSALERLRGGSIADLGFARLDLGRQARTGTPEAVLAEGKTEAEVVAIAERLQRGEGRVLITRVWPSLAEALGRQCGECRHNPRAGTVVCGPLPEPSGEVLVVSAGTSDAPVAEEVTETLAFCGSAVRRLADVGVAGLHRLIGALPALGTPAAIVVVAGMDGALPAVVAGLTDRPVIGVPSPVGYGVAAGGRAALETMLASCAPGLAVVNVSNGFGAAVLAHRINRLVHGG